MELQVIKYLVLLLLVYLYNKHEQPKHFKMYNTVNRLWLLHLTNPEMFNQEGNQDGNQEGNFAMRCRNIDLAAVELVIQSSNIYN